MTYSWKVLAVPAMKMHYLKKKEEEEANNSTAVFILSSFALFA